MERLPKIQRFHEKLKIKIGEGYSQNCAFDKKYTTFTQKSTS